MIDKKVDPDLPKNTFVMIGTHNAVVIDGKGKTTTWDFGRDLREISSDYIAFGMAILKKKGAFPYSRFEQIRRSSSMPCDGDDINFNLRKKETFEGGEKIDISIYNGR